MRKCIVYSNYLKKDIVGIGVFHQFGLNIEEGRNGYASFSTAIVEMPDGVVLNVPVESIKFYNE